MKNITKHILFLPRWYPNRYDPMWGLFVKKHAEAASLYNKVSILYLHQLDRGLKRTEFIEANKGNIHTLYIYYAKPKNKFIYFIKFIYLYFRGLSKIQSKGKIDLIHIHILSRMGLLSLLSYYIKGIPYIITEHWSRYLPRVNTYEGTLRKRLTEIIVQNSKAILPVTENLKSAMLSHHLKNPNYRIIPNVVDEIFFNTQLINSRDKIQRVIHVSTFEDKSKNITGIINMVKELSEIRSDFKMILIGEGVDFNILKELSDANHLHSFIEFTGLLEKEALVKEYAKASFLLINSNYENMPVVINEAMACGLPVLSTNVGGISEHLNDNKGRLIKPNQAQELLEQFQWMLDNVNSFNSSEIRKYAKEHFSFAAVGKQLDEVYHNI